MVAGGCWCCDQCEVGRRAAVLSMRERKSRSSRHKRQVEARQHSRQHHRQQRSLTGAASQYRRRQHDNGLQVHVQQVSAPGHQTHPRAITTIHLQTGIYRGGSETALTTTKDPFVDETASCTSDSTISRAIYTPRCRPKSVAATQQSLPLLHQFSIASDTETSGFYEAECLLPASRTSSNESAYVPS